MTKARIALLGSVTILLVGSLATTAGYAWYWRSEGYRKSCAAGLSKALGLPADIGSVRPRSLSAREYGDVVVWLPDRRDRALSCERAIISSIPTDDDPDAYMIDLRGGSAEISTRTWLRSDFRTVIESGLTPGFADYGPRRVTFSGMNLTFERERFQASLRDASGVLKFEGTERGRLDVVCHEFNGHRLVRPVFLGADFSPAETGILVDHLELKVPRIPLRVIGLDALTGAAVRSGSFQGKLVYGESADGARTLVISGNCYELLLPEWTEAYFPQPWRGRAPEISLRELRFEHRTPVRLRFAGILTGVMLGDLLAAAGLEGVTGEITLRVRDAEFSPEGIVRFIASGECTDLSLESLTSAIGMGRMSGNLRIKIDDLTIKDNRLVSLDAEVIVQEALDTPNWVEGHLLAELITRIFKRKLLPFYPERIEYTRLGVRLDVRDEQLHLFGTHGPREKTIATLRWLERDWPLNEPEGTLDLTPWLDQLRERAAAEIERRLRLLEARHRTASQPARTPVPRPVGSGRE